MTRQRVAVAVPGGLLVFWVGVFVVAAAADGYGSGRDYVSSLAARGSSVWVGGELALAAMAVAHLAVVVVAARRWRYVALTSVLGPAALAVVAVVAFRAACPGGEAGCDLGPAPAADDWVEAVHGAATAAWLLLMVVAMAIVAAGVRGNRPWPRWLAVASIVLALASLGFSGGADGGPHTGLWQRFWLGTLTLWLLAVTAAAVAAPAPSSARTVDSATP